MSGIVHQQYRCGSGTPQEQRNHPRPAVWHWGLVAVLLLLFLAYYAPLAVLKYDVLLVGRDLADVDQAVWWTTQGRPFYMTTHPLLTSRLGLHIEPVLLVLAPLYALAPSAKMLILVQIAALALAAVPLYAFSAETLARPTLALAFPVLYLLSPAIQNAALADFYPVNLGVLPALVALLAVWRGQTGVALLFGGLTLLAREDYGLWLAGLALIGWMRTRKRIWIAVGLGGVAWFLVAILVVMPAFSQNQSAHFWARHRFWLEGPEAWQAEGFLPEKGRYLWQLLLMGGAAAPLAPVWILPALPALGLNLLSNFSLPVSLDSYYSVLIATQILVAAAVGLRRLPSRWQEIAVAFLLVGGLVIHLTEGRSPLVPGFRQPERMTRALPTLLAELPDDASLCASPNVASHASNRTWLRVLPNRANCDWIALDVAGDRSRHPLRMYNLVSNLLGDGWGIYAGQDGFLLLAAGASETAVPAGFYEFAKADRAPQYPTQVVFGEGWEMIGYDVSWDYWGRPVVRLYWRVLQPPIDDRQPAVLAVDPEGELWATPDSHLPVILLWLPTWRWLPGETYVVEMLPFDAPDRIELLAGVGAPLADPASRLHTSDGRDLVSLATLERYGRGWKVQPTKP